MSLDQLRLSWQRKIAVRRVQELVPGDCWIWTGCRTKNRCGTYYGRIQRDGRARYAHRVIYEALIGPIADGLQLDHLCRVTECCNPAHLDPVTSKINVARGLKGEDNVTHCPSGHEYSGDNLRLWTDARGYTRRFCRRCGIDRARAWREARKERQQQTWSKYVDGEAS